MSSSYRVNERIQLFGESLWSLFVTHLLVNPLLVYYFLFISSSHQAGPSLPFSSPSFITPEVELSPFCFKAACITTPKLILSHTYFHHYWIKCSGETGRHENDDTPPPKSWNRKLSHISPISRLSPNIALQHTILCKLERSFSISFIFRSSVPQLLF